MERWADAVLRVAYTWSGSLQDAQDVCQTVLLKLLTHPERFPDPERQRACGPFEAPIDLDKAACVRWNGVEIPIN